MRIAIASDHAAVALKADLREYLIELGHEVADLGPDSADSVDYPDYGYKLASVIADGTAERGVALCVPLPPLPLLVVAPIQFDGELQARIREVQPILMTAGGDQVLRLRPGEPRLPDELEEPMFEWRLRAAIRPTRLPPHAALRPILEASCERRHRNQAREDDPNLPPRDRDAPDVEKELDPIELVQGPPSLREASTRVVCD